MILQCSRKLCQKNPRPYGLLLEWFVSCSSQLSLWDPVWCIITMRKKMRNGRENSWKRDSSKLMKNIKLIEDILCLQLTTMKPSMNWKILLQLIQISKRTLMVKLLEVNPFTWNQLLPVDLEHLKECKEQTTQIVNIKLSWRQCQILCQMLSQIMVSPLSILKSNWSKRKKAVLVIPNRTMINTEEDMQLMMMSITTILMLESMLKEMSTFKIKMDTLLLSKMEPEEHRLTEVSLLILELWVVKWNLMMLNLMLMEVIMVLVQLTETKMRIWKAILKNMSLQIILNL